MVAPSSFFLQCQKRHQIPTYLPRVWSCTNFVHRMRATRNTPTLSTPLSLRGPTMRPLTSKGGSQSTNLDCMPNAVTQMVFWGMNPVLQTCQCTTLVHDWAYFQEWGVNPSFETPASETWGVFESRGFTAGTSPASTPKLGFEPAPLKALILCLRVDGPRSSWWAPPTLPTSILFHKTPV